MTGYDLKPVRGIVQKNVLVGLCLSAILAYMVSVDFAVAALVGSMVCSVNLVIGAWTTYRIIESARQESAIGAGGWTFLLVLKLGALFGVVWWLLARLELDMLGFAVGFGSFLPAMLWQAAVTPGGTATTDDEE